YDRLAEEHERQHVGAERLLEGLGRYLEKLPEVAAHRVVDQYARGPQVRADSLHDLLHARRFGDVDGVTSASRDLPLERREALRVAGQHRNAVPAGGEPSAERRPGAGTDPGDHADLLRHLERLLEGSEVELVGPGGLRLLVHVPVGVGEAREADEAVL